MTKARYSLAAAAIAALVALAVLYGTRHGAVHASPVPPASLAHLVPAKQPKAVAAVSFTGADGAKHALSSFKGRYVLLNLWAVWCGPCVKELPALARLQAAIGQKNLVVVPVDVARGTQADAAAFLKEHGAASLPAYIDTDLAMMRVFGAYGLPLTVLIDPRGREIARAEGPAQWDSPDAIAWIRTVTKG